MKPLIIEVTDKNGNLIKVREPYTVNRYSGNITMLEGMHIMIGDSRTTMPWENINKIILMGKNQKIIQKARLLNFILKVERQNKFI